MGSVLRFPTSDPLDEAIGARLRAWREKRGVSVETMARELSLTPEETRRAEAGRAHLDSVQIGAATRALHLPLWALQSDRPAY